LLGRTQNLISERQGVTTGYSFDTECWCGGYTGLGTSMGQFLATRNGSSSLGSIRRERCHTSGTTLALAI
jgi:hypothetical protein